MSLKTEFKKWQRNHPNPFSRKIVNLKRSDNKIVELTKDPRKEFYGVSVWQKLNEDCQTCNDDREDHWRFEAVNFDLNISFHDRDEAIHYQNMLKNKLKNYDEIKEIVEDVTDE